YNGKPVTGDSYAERGDRAKQLAEREFNLSVAQTLRADNKLVDGKFWAPRKLAQPEVSVEESFAETLGWKVGDTVGFDIAGQAFSARIT
ncbi:permease, partial [Lysobacter sp. 2RAB21]